MTGFGILFFSGYAVYRVFKFFSDRMIENASKKCTGVVPEYEEWVPAEEPIGQRCCFDLDDPLGLNSNSFEEFDVTKPFSSDD